MTRPSLRLSLLPALLLCGCSIGETTRTLRESSPAPELGRPGWVRACADVGGTVGGVIGGVASIVGMPFTYPLYLLSDDQLDERGADQFVFWPASTLSGFGHALFGFPADCVDWTFRRAWIGRKGDVVLANEFVPMAPPVLPAREVEAVDAAAGSPEAR
ncbi:MAG: hypothetical protein H6835_14245 [Planctomycetes bacterium]|nr:hypothetical protein [Planctomycetota bacterium]